MQYNSNDSESNLTIMIMNAEEFLKVSICTFAAYCLIGIVALFTGVALLLLVASSPILWAFLLILLVRQKINGGKYSMDMLSSLEDQILEETLGGSEVRYERTTVLVDLVTRVHLQRIVAYTNKDNPILLYVHGTAASAVGFVDAMKNLSSDFCIHALDVPGFGRSHVENPGVLKNLSNTELCEYYSDCIKLYIQEHIGSNQQVCVVGHSFGGFLASEFSHRYPIHFDSLILVNTGGLLATLGNRGGYWAVFFTAALPQSIMRLMSFLGFDAIAHAMHGLVSTRSLYFYFLLANRSAFGDTFVGRFIKMGCVWSHFTRPFLCKLLESPRRIAVIHGGMDPIMPSHQLELFVSLCGSPVPHFRIEGAGHAPYCEVPNDFCVAFRSAYELACRPDESARRLAKRVTGDSRLTQFRISFSKDVNERIIEDEYRYLKELACRCKVRQQNGNLFVVSDGIISRPLAYPLCLRS